MYSRRLNVEEKENKRKAFGFVLLTIAAILAMYFFGIPAIVKISNFVYDLKKSGEPIVSGDQTPPPPPILNTPPEFTKEVSIELQGRTEPGAKVSIFVNNKDYDVLANNEGAFSQDVELWDGENNIYVIATDNAGNKSSKSSDYTIVFDNKAPEIEVITPRNGEEFYGINGKTLKIEGKSEKDSKVQINDRNAIVDSEGKFTQTISLNDGDNRFVVKSEDLAGNQTEVEFTVKYFR